MCVKFGREQTSRGANVQYKNKHHNISVCDTVREFMQYTTGDAVHGVRKGECTAGVQEYYTARERTRETRECERLSGKTAYKEIMEKTWCKRVRRVKNRPKYPKKSNLTECNIMSFHMDQDPTGNETRPGTSGMYITINCCNGIYIMSQEHRLWWSPQMYKMTIQRSSWHKEYGE